MDDTTTCNECGQLRHITIVEEKVDVASINNNFDLCCGRMKALEDKFNVMFDQDGNLDLGNKCITNLGDCCNDPKSLITAGYVNSVIRQLVAQLVVDMVSDPAAYLQLSGVKFYDGNGDQVVNSL